MWVGLIQWHCGHCQWNSGIARAEPIARRIIDHVEGKHRDLAGSLPLSKHGHFTGYSIGCDLTPAYG